MKLAALLSALPIYNCNAIPNFTAPITRVTSRSQEVIPGTLFVCLDGLHVRGIQYAREALARGAVAVVRTVSMRTDTILPSVFVPDTHIALSLLCSAFYGNPARAMHITAVTGTNGKTSTVHFLEAIYRTYGYRTAMMGTIYDSVCGKALPPSGMTTPDPEEFYKRLAFFRKKKVTHLCMEASSHAMALDKLYGVSFANGVFTNLSADHLDFHKNTHAYLSAKAKLFPACRRSFFCMDDTVGRTLYERFAPHFDCVSYGVRHSADTCAEKQQVLGADGIAYRLIAKKRPPLHIFVPVPGRFTFQNSLAAATCALYDNISGEAIMTALATHKGIPGRLENITPEGMPFTVFSDFAHTPDGLAKTISGVREFAKRGQKITVLFGCGGDRDAAKRPIMGEIAVTLADFVYITEDNSRTESTGNIISMICKDIVHRENFMVIHDRKTAIETAISNAEDGEILLLCGKGHETYIVRGTTKLPFSEREIVRSACNERRKEARSC